MVTALLEFNHALALRTPLPSLLGRNSQDLLNGRIMWTVPAYMRRSLACCACCFAASWASCHISFDKLRRDEGRTSRPMAVRAIGCAEFEFLGEELSHNFGSEKQAAVVERDGRKLLLVAASGREEPFVGEGGLEEALQALSAVLMLAREGGEVEEVELVAAGEAKSLLNHLG